MACEDAGEIATNLWYSQAKNYSYSDPRLNADTDTFTQVRKKLHFSLSRLLIPVYTPGFIFKSLQPQDRFIFFVWENSHI